MFYLVFKGKNIFIEYCLLLKILCRCYVIFYDEKKNEFLVKGLDVDILDFLNKNFKVRIFDLIKISL